MFLSTMLDYVGVVLLVQVTNCSSKSGSGKCVDVVIAGIILRGNFSCQPDGLD